MLTGIGSTIPRIANLPGSSRPGGGGAGPFEYTAIDNNFSMEFDGTNYLNAGNDDALQLTSDISISCWFKSPSITPGQPLVSKRNNAFNLYGYQAYINSSGELQFLVTLSGINTYDARGTTVVTDGQWHHAVFRLKQNDTIDIYLDGQLEATASVGAQSFIESNSDLQIGYQQVGASDYYMVGNIDEVAIWGTMLSEGTIEAIYNTTNDNPGKAADLSETPEGVPVAWYRMGD
jgi:hypothetical protein